MLKLCLCLFSAMLLAVIVLHLRQQKLELAHEANHLHNQIESLQAKLWNQQMRIAIPTAPNAIARTVDGHDLKMVPRAPVPASMNGAGGISTWADRDGGADAE